MKVNISIFIICIMSLGTLAAQGSLEMAHLGNLTGGAEVTQETMVSDALTNRAFVLDQQHHRLLVLDISEPFSPVLLTEVDLSSFGSRPGTVALSRGVVAVHMVDDSGASWGKVLFFDSDGQLLEAAPVSGCPILLSCFVSF